MKAHSASPPRNYMKTFTVSETISKGIKLIKRKEMKLYGIPIGQGIELDIKSLPDGTVFLHHKVDVMEKTDAGLQYPVRIVREQDRRDRRALVSIETPAYDGSIKLTPREKKVWNAARGQLEFRDRPIEEAWGITLYATAESEEGPRFLIGMMPGSALRIVCKGSAKYADRDIILGWSGEWNELVNSFDNNVSNDPKNWGMFMEEGRT